MRTPIAAAVAAATWGLVGDEHMPKDPMFTFGLMSSPVAAGTSPPNVALPGRMERLDGVLPLEHVRVAP
jgi:hypothetical protein